MPSRLARTKRRQAVRARKAREERLKAQIESWIGTPLRRTISAVEERVADSCTQFEIKHTELSLENRKLRERMQVLEKELESATNEVANAMAAVRNEGDQIRLRTIERQIDESISGLKHLRDELAQEREEQLGRVHVFEATTVQRLDDAERNVKGRATREELENLVRELRSYISEESVREEFVRRYGNLLKDMEARVWPWRPNMDRSQSPPSPSKDEEDLDDIKGHMAHIVPSKDARAAWTPWPSRGPVKPTPFSSICTTPSASARPTPPTSRPSSASYQARADDVGFRHGNIRPMSASSAGSGLAAARSDRGPSRGRGGARSTLGGVR